jgi:hypothetical protein
VSNAFVKKSQAGIFRPADLLANFLQVCSVKRDQITHELGIARTSRGRLLTVNAPLDVERPLLGIFSAAESLVDIFPFAPNLGAPRTRL